MVANKEYEMLFKLKAALDGSFGGTFGSATGELRNLQNEIKQVQTVQKDISAYQKQEGAVQSTNSKLRLLREQYKNLQQELENTENPTARMKNATLKMGAEVEKTQDKLREETEKLTQMGDALEDAGVDTSNLTDETKRLTVEMEALKQEQEEVGEGRQTFSDFAKDFAELAAQATIAVKVVKEVGKYLKECVGVAASFEEQMSVVEAISGASAQDMTKLNALAKEMGATTKFTAVEAGQALEYMAMAGWDANQMMGALSGVMNLAAASGEDLALVSDIVTDAMTAFRMGAEQAAYFADVLAATATSSNTNVGIMGETFKNVAPLAGTMGYTIEDMSVAIGLMAWIDGL